MTPRVVAEDRYLSSLSCNHLLRMLSTLNELFDGDLVLGVIFIAINQAATDHLSLSRELKTFDGEGIVPDELRRPVTVLSIAASLNLPRETVRRHVARLIERGYCVQVRGRRVTVPGDVLRRPEFLIAIKRNRRDLKVLLSTLHRAGLLHDDGGPPRPPRRTPLTIAAWRRWRRGPA